MADSADSHSTTQRFDGDWRFGQILLTKEEMLSGGEPGAHGIDGTAAGFVPPLFSRDVVTDVLALPEQAARAMAVRLARKEGIFAGSSTGLNVLAALQLAQEVGKGGTVVTVACDTGFKYLNGDLYR